MERLKIELPEAKIYPPAYHQIMNALKVSGEYQIGSQTESERARSLDLDRTGRACRTIIMINLSMSVVNQIHEMERKQNDLMYSFPAYWFEKKFGLKYEPTVLSEARMTSITEFNDKNRPDPKKFNGVSIPPYFDCDYTFDGMDYHHEWDFNVINARGSLYLPPLVSKRGRKLSEEVE